jgi:hypothetical protein
VGWAARGARKRSERSEEILWGGLLGVLAKDLSAAKRFCGVGSRNTPERWFAGGEGRFTRAKLCR